MIPGNSQVKVNGLIPGEDWKKLSNLFSIVRYSLHISRFLCFILLFGLKFLHLGDSSLFGFFFAEDYE